MYGNFWSSRRIRSTAKICEFLVRAAPDADVGERNSGRSSTVFSDVTADGMVARPL